MLIAAPFNAIDETTSMGTFQVMHDSYSSNCNCNS